tara:strand:- start:1094 stop:2020 length:927 start_codon:yes stop_codon:yes gene_type:complete
MKKKIYFWASDISNNSGEGILANSFIKNYKKNNSVKFINISNNDIYQKKNNFRKFKSRYDTIYHKYFHPFKGVYKLWIYHLNKEKVCYINYLPLWNFLIFFLLPPNALLGPVTGSIDKKLTSMLFFSMFEKLSLLIVKKKKLDITFSHNFYLKKYNLSNKKYKSNFILQDFFYRKKNKIKKFDLIIYYRKGSKLNEKYIINLIQQLVKINLKIAVIGNRINYKTVKNFGYISRKKSISIISQTNYAIANPENLYSYFVQDCLSNQLTVFYNNFFRKFNVMNNKKMVPILFKSYNQDFKIIKNNIRKLK